MVEAESIEGIGELQTALDLVRFDDGDKYCI